VPWLTNTIQVTPPSPPPFLVPSRLAVWWSVGFLRMIREQDQKTKYLDYSKSTCMWISLIFDVYTHIMGIFGLYLMFSQFDFLIIRMVADCIVTVFTTAEWMKNKMVDKVKHDLEVRLFFCRRAASLLAMCMVSLIKDAHW
jgi:hypothetical protein